MSVHAGGTFRFTRGAVPHFRRQGSGRIINVTSYTGLHGNPGQSNYAMAKAGIIGFTKSTAKELARFGITVNAISPNARTRMIDSVPPTSSRSSPPPSRWAASPKRPRWPLPWPSWPPTRPPTSPASCSRSTEGSHCEHLVTGEPTSDQATARGGPHMTESTTVVDAPTSWRRRAGTTDGSGSPTSTATGVVRAARTAPTCGSRPRCPASRPASAGCPTAGCWSSRCATERCCAGSTTATLVSTPTWRPRPGPRQRHGRGRARPRVRRQLRLRPDGRRPDRADLAAPRRPGRHGHRGGRRPVVPQRQRAHRRTACCWSPRRSATGSPPST